ncbi:MAG: hypothetical protein EOP43_07725, partial [Sphingobacteriaceae bacterium]
MKLQSRRTFIKQTSLVTGATLVSVPAFSKLNSTSTPMYNSPNFNGKVFVNPIPTQTGLSSNVLKVTIEYLKSHPN